MGGKQFKVNRHKVKDLFSILFLSYSSSYHALALCKKSIHNRCPIGDSRCLQHETSFCFRGNKSKWDRDYIKKNIGDGWHYLNNKRIHIKQRYYISINIAPHSYLRRDNTGCMNSNGPPLTENLIRCDNSASMARSIIRGEACKMEKKNASGG